MLDASGLIQQRSATPRPSRARSRSRCCARISCRAASRRDRTCPRPSLPRATGSARRRSAARWSASANAAGCRRCRAAAIVVKPITLRDIGEIFALRRMLEPVAARHAAGRADVNRLRQLDAVCGAGFVAGDPASQATFLQAHRQLHLAIVTAGGNERLTDVFAPLWDESERVIHHTGADAQPRRRAAARSCGADRGARDRARRRGRRGSRGRDRAAASRDRRCGAHHVEHAGAATRGSRAGRERPIRGTGKTGRQSRAIEQ